MTQPEGFEVPGKENLVCKLHKSLYGLKQAPRQWYKKFNEFMSNSGFKRCDMTIAAMLKNILIVMLSLLCMRMYFSNFLFF